MKSKKVRLSRKKIFIVASIVIVIIVGIVLFCLSGDSNIKNNDEKKEENNQEVKEKEIEIIDLKSDSRPYAVMINNISTVWGYQSGVQDAYLVYEIIVEGGYTRLMALFKDKELERIGSVRSSRHYFLDYALENDAVYVHFGWSPQAESDIKSLGVNNVNFLSYNGYTRDTSLGLPTEHTAYTSTDKIKSGIKNYNYRDTSDKDTLLNYSSEEIDLSSVEGSITVNKVNIPYSASHRVSFEYDAEKKVYKRFQNSKSHTDYVTKEQYTTKNIIAYSVGNKTISGDSKGRQDLDNIGTGEGYYITDGYAIPITWSKSSRGGQTVYKYLDGTEIDVNDGNTYIEIYPEGQSLTFE